MMNKKDLSIYIHIPFCVQKCLYCDFLSAPSTDEIKDKYVKSLIGEIENMEHKEDYIIKSIFFGGGTPSAIKAELITEIMDVIHNCYQLSDDVEITIECNPGTVDNHKFSSYRQCGINRISFGLQSADNDELKSIGRIHTWEQFLESYQLALDNGFTNINVDLISALPNQTMDGYHNTLEKVLNLNPQPTHISAYSLILEEGTPLFDRVEALREQGLEPIPDEDTDRAMYYMARKLLETNGYHQYEISNYAKQGFECYHNKVYWSCDEYVGFGLGAASYINNCRYSNIRSITDYIDMPAIEEKEVLTKEDCMEEFVFLGLRQCSGINIKEFEKRFLVSFEQIYGAITDKFVNGGFLVLDNDMLYLTEKGMDVSNSIMSEYILTES